MRLRSSLGYVSFASCLAAALWDWATKWPETRGGWGIDAVLTRHVPGRQLSGYHRLLTRSGVGWLRERGVGTIAGTLENPGIWSADVREGFRSLKANGHNVVAFAGLSFSHEPIKPGNQLPEDLLEVYRQGCFLGREFFGLVDAWEMVGEPDLGYCTDLPDRVVAYQKALYLGIKTGSLETADLRRAPSIYSLNRIGSSTNGGPNVLMGALGMPPGPWLDRAVANGLLDYTDAYNFHFYGLVDDFSAVLKAHREVGTHWGRHQLPLWITECGFNTVAPDDFLNPQRRQLQADYTVTAAKQALAAEDAAVFMPFILVHDKDPYAMTLAADKPLPAWEAYAKFTRENPWPKRALAHPPEAPNPIVLQWLPDNKTATAHKVSGTYRFQESGPIRGEYRIYNFSRKPVRGFFKHAELQHVEMRQPIKEVEIKPMSMTAVSVEFAPRDNGYFQEYVSANFEDNLGRRAPLYFGLERWPESRDFESSPLQLAPATESRLESLRQKSQQVTSQAGVWTGMNGLRLAADAQELSGWTDAVGNDPLLQPYAVAALSGLPATGFIHLGLDRPMDRQAMVRVDLLAPHGRRYTIWENFGVSYFRNSTEVWLNLADFNGYTWGDAPADKRFDPTEVNEIQVRFYLRTPGTPMRVRLSLMRVGEQTHADGK